MSIDYGRDLFHENLLNFRGSSLPDKIPDALKMDSYKMLWGAGDVWILNRTCISDYDIFVSFGISQYGSAFGNPPSDGLRHPGTISDITYNDKDVLLENLELAKTHTTAKNKKIIVYIDINNLLQRNRFVELFEEKITLFEELGIHNDIQPNNEYSEFLDRLLINNYRHTINFSLLDINNDGSRIPRYIRPRRDAEGLLLDEPIEVDRIGKDPNYIGAYFIESDPGVRPIVLYTNTDIMDELKEYIRRFDIRSPFYERINYINIFVNLDELSLEELNFISVILHNLDRFIPNIFRTNKYIISFNKTPRLYSKTAVLRISFHKLFSRFLDASKRYFTNAGKHTMKKTNNRRRSKRKQRKRLNKM